MLIISLHNFSEFIGYTFPHDLPQISKQLSESFSNVGLIRECVADYNLSK